MGQIYSYLIYDFQRKYQRSPMSIVLGACAYGGIGRRVGFRFQWETVWVRVPLSAFKTL